MVAVVVVVAVRLAPLVLGAGLLHSWDRSCPRCDGSGYRPRKYCAGCGEPAGSISQGTGAPLLKDRRTDGRFYHVRCLPG